MVTSLLDRLQDAKGATAAVRTAASDVLVALARSHLHDVVSALQGRLKAMEEVLEEFILITLRNLAARYALQCVPFAETTLSALRGVLSMVGSGRMLSAVCGAVEQWCRGISMYLREGEKCAFPRLGAAQLCTPVYPLFCYAGRNWRGCEQEEVKQAVLRAMGAMMGVLLHAEEHREHVWEQLLWLLHQYRDVWDPLGVTTLCDVIELPSPEHRAELCCCITLLAQICPEEMIVFLYCKLRNGSKADRVAAVEMLQALVRSDAPDTREKLPLFAKLAQSVCRDTTAQATGKLCAVEAREERAIQCLCVHVLGTLDISAGAVAKLLWPRLLRYVVPAEYTGMLVPLCRCLRALAERQERAEREEEEAAPEALESEEQGTTASSLDAAEWESLLLKRFLYKALGTALAACGCLRHVRKQTLKHLKAANFLELWEAQGMVSVVSRCAESHFQLALSSVKEFTGTLKHQKSDTVRTHATRAALMVTYGQMALRAPREQLLAHVERDVVGNVLQLYREGCQGVQAPSLRALGQFMAALLRAELVSICLKDMVQVLRRWLASTHACERERALQVCVQLLGAYEDGREHRRDRTCEQFGSLAGLLGPLTCDVSAVSRQRAATCLGHLLQIGAPAETTDVVPWTNEIGHLRERLGTVTSESLLATSANIAKLVCKYFPRGQATDFVSTVVESLLCARRVCAWAAGRWTLTFLGECGEQIFQEEVPELVRILYTCLQSTRQSTRRRFVLRAMFLLVRSHQQPVLNSLLQKQLPTDSDTVEVWRSLGRSALGRQILERLAKKLRAAGKSSHGSDCCTQELGSSQAALEPRTITRALSEVVSVLRSKRLVQHLLPCLLPSLLGQVSETLGEEMALSLGELGSDDTPGSVLLRAELVPQRLVQSLFPWLDSRSANLRLTATAFFAELMKDKVVEKRKLLKPLLEALVARSRDPVSTVQQMAVRGVGNMASGAPAKLRRHSAAVVEVLLGGLEDVAGAEVAAERLLALAKVLGQLKARAVGSAFEEIARSTRAFLGAEEEVLRCSAFTLYSALASSASGRRSLFSREVQEAFPSLVLHLRDPAPAVSNACKVALHLCAPFLGSKRVRRRIAASTGLSAAELQDEVCSHLARDCPALLERLFSTAQSCCTGSYQASQVAAVIVLGVEECGEWVVHVWEEHSKVHDRPRHGSRLHGSWDGRAEQVKVWEEMVDVGAAGVPPSTILEFGIGAVQVMK
ncbi:maestro heat-like repeat-containing protein family member 2B, partial [Apteryx mantelli]|uniref:Maestro heat-like repeat-containing protein family member 2B n=1 Tax=Apteryx mantelli TaxID=2696672 RepID=A0ABM4F8D5_9AVES